MDIKKEKPSGMKDILNYMRTHQFITDEDAREQFGVHRLSARIHDLREKGFVIDTVIVDGITRYNRHCKYARYFLRSEP